MCMGGGAAAPAAPAAPITTPPPPTLADPAITAARAANQNTAALAEGRGATIMSSPQGDLTPASTTKKTALGL